MLVKYFILLILRSFISHQVFDMDALQSVWEQELYNEIDYMNKDKLFHCFEGDTTMVGLSFMDDKEANHFYEAVQERIAKRRSRAAK